jgi:outer membrane protein assembly factor BamB
MGIAAALSLVAACAPGPTLRVSARWQWHAPAPAYMGAPASNGGHIAATYGHAVLVLVDARSGRLAWEAQRVGLRDVAPAFAGDLVFAATDDGVAAFERGDGRLVWERQLGDRASTPLVLDGTPVVTTWDGRLVSLGRTPWTVALPGPSLGPPAAADGVVVASCDTGVLAVDSATAQVLWQHDFDGPGTSAPAVSHGLAIVVGGDRRAHAFDLRSGQERWSLPMRGAGSPEAPPQARGGRVALVDRLGDLVVVSAATGRSGWSWAGPGAVVRGGPVFVGAETVALPLDDGRLAIATRHAHVLRPFDGRVSGVAAIDGGGRLVVATREGDSNGLITLRLG